METFIRLAVNILAVSSAEWYLYIYEMTERFCEGNAYSSVTDTLQFKVAAPMVSPFGMPEYTRSVTNVIFLFVLSHVRGK